MRVPKIYGYVRVSTKKQKPGRQIENIKAVYPDAIIIVEMYSGTTLDRPKWNKLEKVLKEGDTVVYDEVSRMSRDAEEGYTLYKELYGRGINLVFLKESTLNTENFKQTTQLALVGDDIADIYIEATNRALMLLAEKQIKAAFATAQHEVDFLHKRTAEGVQKAIADGKTVGRSPGTTLTTKKGEKAKEIIRQHSVDFGGTLSDVDLIKLAGISRNTFYKFKRELKVSFSV